MHGKPVGQVLDSQAQFETGDRDGGEQLNGVIELRDVIEPRASSEITM